MTRFALRQARAGELGRLMAFYRANANAALPAPSIQVLGKALGRGRLLIVEPVAGGPILASSAVFEFTPEDCPTYVGELSGTRVTGRLNGFGPLGVQRLLLAARLLNHAAAESTVGPGCSTTLITIVKSDNRGSLGNVAAAGFERLDPDERPDWIAYEELAWNGATVGDEWTYFVATEGTIRQAVAEMRDIGLFDGMVRLERTDRATEQPDVIEIEVRLPELVMGYRDLLAILAGERACGLGPPPTDLVLA